MSMELVSGHRAPGYKTTLGSRVQWLVCVSVWLLLCLPPTHPRFSTNLHLNRDFFFLMRRTQGSPQTIKFSSGGCVEPSSFAPPSQPPTPPPPTSILFSGSHIFSGPDEALALTIRGHLWGQWGQGFWEDRGRTVLDPHTFFLFVCGDQSTPPSTL